MKRQYNPDVAGTIFNIQRFSVHDGPGIRTVVFIKGCTLRCLWCSNPESIESRLQLGVYPDRCIGIDKCGQCRQAAPDQSALIVENNRITRIESENQLDYTVCASVCPTNAIKVWGQRVTVAEVLHEVLKDKDFYLESGGGITLSGGEALIQPQFTIELLRAARAEGINTCMETALNYRQKTLDEALPLIDLLFCDLKHMDCEKHLQFTAVSNQLILANIKHVVASGKPTIIRIPVVPEHNGTEENIRATARFIKEELNGKILQVQLLPFRKLGEDKYASLGREYPMATLVTPEREVWEKTLLSLAEVMREYGVPAVAGTNHKISV
ncbi:glycyl-radical enzyme activating protein [Desulforhopalus singaporensis]|uniref:Pyruvate formate lyase activating enzyme n=1 Tax=Desulforhopalus singaporensis TaxID=91360 RepID=A0A1H0LSY4_9BACT|nr:glycyl-radical enzyme activating protein [Desulforhopalus singaporensis]SDO71342.1 pyruvate formate lyase activating enzyme [Desulforhopalus singaporensis]